jgi:hypothetical protein
LDLRVDEWVMPSHVQIGRVLDGGLDAAVAWAGSRDDRLDFRLLWPEPLVAVAPARRTDKTVQAAKLRVLVDADLTSYTDTLPARLRTRRVVDPCPLWCWSLVTRADDDRETIAALREHASTVARIAGLHAVPVAPTWLPSRDPHRDELTSSPA